MPVLFAAKEKAAITRRGQSSTIQIALFFDTFEDCPRTGFAINQGNAQSTKQDRQTMHLLKEIARNVGFTAPRYLHYGIGSAHIAVVR
jgi:hypothetical protein